MKKSRCTEEQIIEFLKEAEAGFPIADLCRRQNCLKAKSENYRANLDDNTSPFHEKIIDLFPSNKNNYSNFVTVI